MRVPYKSLFESHEEEIPDWVCGEIKRYNKDAGKNLNTSIIPYIQKYLPKEKITIYRGLGFEPIETHDILKKLKFKKAEIGENGLYQSGKIQSWSLSKSIAEDFAGKYVMGAHRIKESLGIILKTEVNPKEIALPIAFLPLDVKKQCLHFHQEEILLNPGKYNVEIVSLIGKWENLGVSIKKLIQELGEELAKKTNAELTKNWKSPGFGLDFTFHKTASKKWAPSIQFLIDTNFSIFFETYGPNAAKEKFNPSWKIHKSIGRNFTSQADLVEYLTSRKSREDFHSIFDENLT